MSFRSAGAGDMDGRDGRTAASAAAAAAMGLARQSSIYSLTLDEFQHTLGGLGKDFGSMNMDEFLKSIWIAEETQAMASAVGFGDATAAAAAAAPGLQRQGSLTLPRTISLKTVDEVWRDIAYGEEGGAQWVNLPAPQQQQQQQRQANYGEMTLEEFLVKAGVVREDVAQCSQAASADAGCSNGGCSTDVLFGGFPIGGDAQGLRLGLPPPAQCCNGGGGGMQDGVENAGPSSQDGRLHSSYNDCKVRLVSSIAVGSRKREAEVGVDGMGVAFVGGGNVDSPDVRNGDLSSLSPASCMFDKGQGRKPSNMEKAVERRQKRMIKNRESAARSRARKQAYTMELEAEVAKLKEQNQDLMTKQAKMLEIQKKQILESINNKKEESKKRKLKRTLTGPW